MKFERGFLERGKKVHKILFEIIKTIFNTFFIEGRMNNLGFVPLLFIEFFLK
jgi:hypothetical protein